jgi:hypothetical protein
MSLDKDKILIPNLTTVFASFPLTKEIAATMLANAYNTYALKGSACSGSPPTLVNIDGLIDGLKEALESSGNYLEKADVFSAAFETYWTGALFGPTGAVITISGTEALKTGLAGLWAAQSVLNTDFSISAQQHGLLLDAFTKTVLVKDTAVPPPSGCGPSPIT